jgi:hypothetical protein
MGGKNMKNKMLAIIAMAGMLLTVTSVFAAGGFDQFGYNEKANNFVGTGSSWCQGKLGWDKATCDAYMGVYANDKLVMKWNEAWDECNDAGNNDPEACAGAWTNNQWNGKGKDGSGEVWHYKIVWVGPCGTYGTVLDDGGYCIWGSYEVVMDQGTAGGVHSILAKATPSGYGSYK